MVMRQSLFNETTLIQSISTDKLLLILARQDEHPFDWPRLYVQYMQDVHELKTIGVDHFHNRGIDMVISSNSKTIAVTDTTYGLGMANSIHTYHVFMGKIIPSVKPIAFIRHKTKYVLGSNLTLCPKGVFLETIAVPPFAKSKELPSYFLRYRRIGPLFMLVHSVELDASKGFKVPSLA